MPVPREEQGKLPYDIQLRAPKERKRRVQSFAGAVAESLGSGSTSTFRSQKTQYSKSSEARSSMGDGSYHSKIYMGDSEDHEVMSPLKQ